MGFALQEKQTKEALTRKQQKCRRKNQDEDSQEAPELLKRPKEYTVRFTFPNPPPLSPPVLGLHGEHRQHGYPSSPPSTGPSLFSKARVIEGGRTFRITLKKKRNCCFSWLSGVTFGYEGQKPLFKNLDFGIDMDSRSKFVPMAQGCGAGATGRVLGTSLNTCLLAVCIVGPNGVGKSTLLLLLTGKLTPVRLGGGGRRDVIGQSALEVKARLATGG